MTISLKHAFVSSIPDGADTSVVRPSNWNAEHTITLAADTLLGRATSGSGAAEEVTCTAAGRALLDDVDAAAQRATLGLGTMAVAAAADYSTTAAIAAAYQPLDAELTSLASASANGVSLVTAADYAAMRTLLALDVGTNVQAWDAQLDSLSAATANGVALVTAADYAAMKALLDLEIGTDIQAYSANLDEWSGINPSANGGSLVAAADYAAMRALLDLEIGTDIQAYDADLDAVAGLASAGLVARTGAGTAAARTVTGTAAEITVTNGDGVSGNPTLSLPSAITLTGKTLTGGTFASPTAITGLPNPTDPQDVATKAYVDSAAAGLLVKDPVAVATTANITLSGEQTIDGVLTSTSRVLVKNQTAPAENGIYVSAAGAWSRSTGMDEWAEVPSAYTFVSGGSTQAATGWFCTSGAGGTLDTTAITWSQFSGSSSYTAGTGLQLSGGAFSISDAELLALAGLTSAADKLPYFTGSGTASVTDFTTFARSILDDADEATFKATVNLEIGTDVQAYDAGLTDIAALAVTDGNIIVGNGTNWVAESGSTARASLGLAIGTDVQAYRAGLADIAGLAVTDGNVVVGNGTNWVAESGSTARASLGLAIGTNVQAWDAQLDSLSSASANGVSLVTAADYAAMKALLDLEIGTDVQAYDAELAALAGLTSASNKLPYFTGSGTADVADFTAAGRTMVAAADAAAQTALLSVVTGDSGSGGLKGLVPAPTAGDAAAGKFLKADGTWTALAGGGDLVSTNNLSDVANAATAASNLGLGTGDSPQFTAINLGDASDTTITRSAAGILAVEGVVVAMAGKHAIYIPATSMTTRTTNGAAAGTVETGSFLRMIKSYDFDATTQEFTQFQLRMPKSWDEGTVTVSFSWSHASTTTNFGVVWAVEATALSDGDDTDVAWGTAQQVADTGGTTNRKYITSETSALTIAGTPQAEDLVSFQFKRVPGDGSDTMAIDARLEGVTIHITTNAATDA